MNSYESIDINNSDDFKIAKILNKFLIYGKKY